jgi:excisionase family DNA binding protein
VLDTGKTVKEVAALYRVSHGTVRGWVKARLLEAVNTGRGRRGRLVFTPAALAKFEEARRPVAAEPEKPKRWRRPRCPKDYYPD